ncbi:hypothetical protein GCM10008906_10280 [Clostridium oceanicum]|uniref:Uncharacterized protein n=1 Tax=Clostridium oceanicum TaxID=1543 RepID=A0ABN1JCG1_9CLOT
MICFKLEILVSGLGNSDSFFCITYITNIANVTPFRSSNE